LPRKTRGPEPTDALEIVVDGNETFKAHETPSTSLVSIVTSSLSRADIAQPK
jgi:hypothetical protein